MKKIKEKHWILLIFALAISIRLLYVIAFYNTVFKLQGGQIAPDTFAYNNIAILHWASHASRIWEGSSMGPDFPVLFHSRKGETSPLGVSSLFPSQSKNE